MQAFLYKSIKTLSLVESPLGRVATKKKLLEVPHTELQGLCKGWGGSYAITYTTLFMIISEHTPHQFLNLSTPKRGLL